MCRAVSAAFVICWKLGSGRLRNASPVQSTNTVPSDPAVIRSEHELQSQLRRRVPQRITPQSCSEMVGEERLNPELGRSKFVISKACGRIYILDSRYSSHSGYLYASSKESVGLC
jgi:hypothetical protein